MTDKQRLEKVRAILEHAFYIPNRNYVDLKRQICNALNVLRPDQQIVFDPELLRKRRRTNPKPKVSLGKDGKPKCTQCQYPHHDGICECDQWGPAEDSYAKEWHKAYAKAEKAGPDALKKFIARTDNPR